MARQGNRDRVTDSVSAAFSGRGMFSIRAAMIAHALRDIELS